MRADSGHVTKMALRNTKKRCNDGTHALLQHELKLDNALQQNARKLRPRNVESNNASQLSAVIGYVATYGWFHKRIWKMVGKNKPWTLQLRAFGLLKISTNRAFWHAPPLVC